MTFLELVVRLRAESGGPGTGPSAVTSQSGESLRFVNWINSAWEDIQNAQTEWRFMRFGFTVNTIANVDSYASASCTDTTTSAVITSFDHWARDSFKLYTVSLADELELIDLPYDDWRQLYRTRPQVANRPTNSTVLPDNKIGLGAKPAGVYVLSGDYYRAARLLANNGDTPTIQAQFHMAIVWKALMYYAAYEEAGSLYATAEKNYTNVYGKMLKNQMPMIESAGPMV